MKVGVFVGSFNPIHIGHEKIIKLLLDKKIVDKVIVIPTLSYWDKSIDVRLQDRINMLKTIENDNILINTTLNTKEYTYQVLNELSKEYNDLYLIIGADNIANFDKWKNVEEILNHHVIVVGRNNININNYLSKFDKSKFIIVESNYEISSTEIRKIIKNNDYSALKEIVNNKVIEYIKTNKIYLE